MGGALGGLTGGVAFHDAVAETDDERIGSDDRTSTSQHLLGPPGEQLLVELLGDPHRGQLLPLPGEGEGAVDEVHVGPPQSSDLGPPETAQEAKKEDHAVPLADHAVIAGGQEGRTLLTGQPVVGPYRPAWGAETHVEPNGRVPDDQVLPGGPLEDGPDHLLALADGG